MSLKLALNFENHKLMKVLLWIVDKITENNCWKVLSHSKYGTLPTLMK